MLAVKILHLVCVAVSLGGFLLRLYWRLRSPVLAQQKWVRIAPHIVDTLLLASGVTLVFGTGYSWQTPWLLAKLVALVMYILLGMKAFRWARDRRQTLMFGMGALAVFAYMAGTALSKNPAWLLGG